MAVMVIGGLLLMTVLLGVLGTVVGTQTGVLSAVTVATPAVDPELRASLLAGTPTEASTGSVALVPGGGSTSERTTPPPPFAAVEDIALSLPLAAAGGVVFLEADSAAAVPLAPVGTMTANDNPDGFTPDQTYAGPEFAVHEPISGVRPATGMAAILAAPGTPVLAPVEGTVRSVTSRTDDDGRDTWAVAISPEGRPDLSVVVRRLEAPMVAVGDAVTVGSTPLGAVRPGVVIEGTHNPLALPSALVHVQSAVEGVEVLAPE